MIRRTLVSTLLLLLVVGVSVAKKKADEESSEAEKGPFQSETFKGLALRSIGPALTSGRISDIAVDPRNRARYFVAVASGGVWKTVNAGTIWTPVFDGEGSYSIGCVTLDPANPLTVWVGTGENNSQRSVSYGDGVYKSIDGGTTWKKMGLENSEHIGKIVVDPRDSNTVYVASQGPLWKAGGDRGLYKTTDGGENWELVLEINEHTGITDIVYDPRNPDVLYAAAYQRRRRVWTLIDGGPESALYKSNDAGKTWDKLENGLPTVDIGRIGLAISPVNPDVVYAIIEAEDDAGGFFRTVDAGANWEKRSDYVSGSPQYYNEIVADPVNVDRVYSMDTWMMVTEDGGKSFRKVGERAKHVDNHALWIDPDDVDYLLAGCDGGIYESFDRGGNWHFKTNLPVTQFYRVTPDNDTPFYNVYGGTQDNFTLGGPSRTTSTSGITNREWYVTVGGDGFKTRIDPGNPDIIYSQYQYGGLIRFDRASGELIDIQPQTGVDDEALRWNWNSPLIISSHSSQRLYYAAQRVFRSDDRGAAWTPVGGDLTRRIDRNQLEVMGRIQKADAVAKSASTSPYGNIVSLSESPLVEGRIYAGTDDGLVQLLDPDAGDWTRIESFTTVPEMTYVSDLEASLHDADTVYAAFDNHKNGDFKPYLLKSTDRGRSWKSIVGDLPERGSVHSVVEDHVVADLLFVGTEFGVFFSTDGGARWVQLSGGIPIVAARDIEIQRRENDLVVGTFGRGIYILDDYTPLRQVNDALLERDVVLFPVKPAWVYMPSFPLGLRGKSLQGDSFFTAPNPPSGAVFTYYLKDEIKTRKKQRQEREKESEEAGTASPYPTWDELRAEQREQAPAIVLSIADENGNVIRRLTGPTTAGLHRVAWDLRYPPSEPTRLKEPTDENPFRDPRIGPMVAPGTYTVSLARQVDGESVSVAETQRVEARPLGLATLSVSDRGALLAFQRKTARLQRAVLGAVQAGEEAQTRIDHLDRAALDTPDAADDIMARITRLENRLKDLQIELSGDRVRRSRNHPTPPSIVERVQRIVGGQWSSTSPPTRTNLDAFAIAGEAFSTVLPQLQDLIEDELAAIEAELDAAGAPWTPGRVPRWTRE